MSLRGLVRPHVRPDVRLYSSMYADPYDTVSHIHGAWRSISTHPPSRSRDATDVRPAARYDRGHERTDPA